MRRLFWLLLFAGCYNPKIKDAAFKCGPNNLCPSGFTCVANACFANGHMPDLSVQAFHGNCALGSLDLSAVFSGGPGVVTVDTETGEMVAKVGSVDGGMDADMLTTLVMPRQNGFERPFQKASDGKDAGPAVALWNFDSLTIPKDVRLEPTSGSKAVLALAACGDLDMSGTLAWKGYGGIPGSAGKAGNVRFKPDEFTDLMGGGGGGMDGSGGGGGGHVDLGESGSGPTGGMGGVLYGTPTLAPVMFQGAGGGGGGGNGGGIGGAGGGAVALFAKKLVVAGSIEATGAPGDDGKFGTGVAGGGGGGSGGSILLSADTIELRSGHGLFAAGGAGGMGLAGGSHGGKGADGRIFMTAAGKPSIVVFTGNTNADVFPVVPTDPLPLDHFPQ